MADTAIVRCPVCLTSQVFPSTTPADKTINCGNCDRNFKFGKALKEGGPGTDHKTDAAAKPALVNTHFTIEEDNRGNPSVVWLVGLFVCFLFVLFVRDAVRHMRGPEFLLSYFFVFIILFVTVLMVRRKLDGNPHITWLGFIAFEAIGVLRYVDASAVGMSRFDFMFFMMGVGGIFMFFRASKSGDGSWFGGNCSSCSSCSGCGGGGGCGGCG
ncbi:MAG: hypothetical protein OEZ68_11635 [Gammaproteobacteria bacterium]|nr:hypothetical protein [Gammaproteobacteria bacterium]MDH5801445.1 hypothetical protein [Gammaproteobacteria bacterium]